MVRRMVEPEGQQPLLPDVQVDVAKDKMRAFLGQPAPRQRDQPRRPRAKPLTPLEAAVKDATVRAASGEWEDAGAGTIVGLYALCHQRLYGVEPIELKTDFGMARRRVMTLLRDEFDGDVDAFVQFVRWAWLRQERRVARSGPSDYRMGWRVQFSSAVLTDWRVANRPARRS